MSSTFNTRRRILNSIAVACLAIPLSKSAYSKSIGYVFSGPAADRDLGLLPLKPCTSSTRSSTAGPFYTPSTPLRSDLREPDTTGSTLVLEGLVMTSDCRPVAGAVIDIWHCDENGRYDNIGYRYRGHQYTDSAGSYQFITIRPTIYTGRTEHIHVKVQGEGTRLLTTQIYFPDQQAHNSQDWIFKDELLMDLKKTEQGWYGRFDFVL